MKKKFTLILASMFLCMGTAWAQLNFTFTRGTTLDNSVVKVTDIDGNEVSGVTANIAATAPSNAWNTGNAMATATNVLCANTIPMLLVEVLVEVILSLTRSLLKGCLRIRLLTW